ncbi:MAG: polyprenyl synthetase family protein [Desulfitobacteriaceae bacterium]
MVLVKTSFQEELEEVQEQLRREITLKAAKFNELVPLVMDELDNNACPVIILAVSKACGYAGKQATTLGVIIQYIYMADKVHRLMRDTEDLTEELRQFPVLVGDFLFGKFFLGLCRDKLLNYLAPLARVIVTMSQGSISRWLARDRELGIEEQLEILESGTASLTGLAARIGAELAGVSPTIQQKCETFGRLLGLAWSARNEQMEKSLVLKTLQKAALIFDEAPGSLFNEQLLELYNYIEVHLYPTPDLGMPKNFPFYCRK